MRLQDHRLQNHWLFELPYHTGFWLASCGSLFELDAFGTFRRIVDFFWSKKLFTNVVEMVRVFIEHTTEFVTGLDCPVNLLCSGDRPRSAARRSESALAALIKHCLVVGLKPSFPCALSPTLVVYTFGNVKLSYTSDLFVDGDCGTRISLTVLPRIYTALCCRYRPRRTLARRRSLPHWLSNLEEGTPSPTLTLPLCHEATHPRSALAQNVLLLIKRNHQYFVSISEPLRARVCLPHDGRDGRDGLFRGVAGSSTDNIVYLGDLAKLALVDIRVGVAHRNSCLDILSWGFRLDSDGRCDSFYCH